MDSMVENMAKQLLMAPSFICERMNRKDFKITNTDFTLTDSKFCFNGKIAWIRLCSGPVAPDRPSRSADIRSYVAIISLIWWIGSILIFMFPPLYSTLKLYLSTPYALLIFFRFSVVGDCNRDCGNLISVSWSILIDREKWQSKRITDPGPKYQLDFPRR